MENNTGGNPGTETNPGTGTHGATDAPASWLDSAPAEYSSLKEAPSLKSFKTHWDAAKGYVELSSKLGNSIALPSATDKPEEIATKSAEIYKKLGQPEKADEYKVQVPDIRGKVWNENLHKNVLGAFHKAGLNDAQANIMYGAIAEQLNAVIPNPVQEAEAGEKALRQVWKSDVEYDRNVSLAVRAMESLLGKKVLAKIETSPFGSDPDVLSKFAELGLRLQEDGLLPPAESQFLNQKDLEVEKKTIQADPDYLGSTNKVRHAQLVQRAYEINQLLYNPVTTA